MTNAEAIKIAQGLITDFKCESETMVEFCNIVIKALSVKPQSDLISREAILNKIAEIDNLSEAGKTDEALALMKECFENLTPKQTEWISVKEHGKPKKSGKYWVTIQSTTSDVKWVRADEYHAERDFFDTKLEWSNSGIKITAWQPIIEPSPYKGD